MLLPSATSGARHASRSCPVSFARVSVCGVIITDTEPHTLSPRSCRLRPRRCPARQLPRDAVHTAQPTRLPAELAESAVQPAGGFLKLWAPASGTCRLTPSGPASGCSGRGLHVSTSR